MPYFRELVNTFSNQFYKSEKIHFSGFFWKEAYPVYLVQINK